MSFSSWAYYKLTQLKRHKKIAFQKSTANQKSAEKKGKQFFTTVFLSDFGRHSFIMTAYEDTEYLKKRRELPIFMGKNIALTGLLCLEQKGITRINAEVRKIEIKSKAQYIFNSIINLGNKQQRNR